MNTKGELSIGTILIIFIGIIVGLVFIGEIATQQGVSTTKSNIINESLNFADARSTTNSLEMNTSISFNVVNYNDDDESIWKRTSCALSSFSILNQSNITLVSGTDYEVTLSIGNVTFLDTHSVNGSTNDTLLSYTHCRDGYNTDGGPRSIANLWTLFAALILVAFVIFGIREWLTK